MIRSKFLSRLKIRLLLLTLVTVAPTLVVIVHHGTEQRRLGAERASEQVMTIARQIATRERDLVQQTAYFLGRLAQVAVANGGKGKASCDDLLAQVAAVIAYYENLFVVDREGWIRCSAIPLARPVNVADRPYFRRAMENGAFSVGDFQESRISGHAVMVFAQPLAAAGGKVSGIVAAGIDPAWLKGLLGGVDLPAGIVVSLADSHGQIVARYPDPERLVGGTLPELPAQMSVAAQRGEGLFESRWLDGVNRITAVVPIVPGESEGLYVRVGYGRDLAYADADRILRRDIGVLGAAVLLALMLGWIASQRLIIRRVSDLAATARRIGRGDWQARTSLPPDDGELGELAAVLDESAAALQLRHRQLVEMEGELRRSNRALRVLNGEMRLLAETKSEQELLDGVCRLIADSGNYVMAWVGYADDDAARRIRPVAHAGHDDGYLGALDLTWAESERGLGPSGTAIRTGQPCIVRRIADDPGFAPWREAALQRGYASAISLPLRDDQGVFGGLTIMAGEADAFDAEEAGLLTQAADDLAFGIVAQRTREGRSRAEQALHDSEARLARILRSVDSAVWSVILGSGQLSYINEAAERIYGRPLADFYRNQNLWLEVIHPEDRQRVVDGLPDMLARGAVSRIYRIVRPDGSIRWLHDRVSVERDQAGQPRRLDGIVIDITSQWLLEESLRLRNRAIEASHNGMLIVELDQPPRIISVNAALLALLQVERGMLVGEYLHMLLVNGFDPGGFDQLAELLGLRREGNVVLAVGEDRQAWFDVSIAMVEDESGEPTHAIVEFHDITESRRYQAQIERHVNYDDLTGLPNRNLLQDRLGQALSLAIRMRRQLFVLWLDLDRLQAIRDSLGQREGDAALQATAQRIGDEMAGAGTVARPEADALVLVADSLPNPEALVVLVGRLLQAIRQPLQLAGQEVVVGTCIGVAVAPNNGRNPEALLRNARMAAIRARERGAGNFCFYEEEMNSRAQLNLRLEFALRQAIESSGIGVAYQPKADLLTGKLVGCEALLRWNDPELGAVPLRELMAIAEESGLIRQLDAWMLASVCATLRQWLDAGIDCVSVAVNVSARLFLDDELIDELRGLLVEHRLDPGRLVIEVTESVLMSNPALAARQMAQLKRLGVRLAIDDFGTGYSSLGALKHFPVDYLKIDRSFVVDVTASTSDASIALAVISLAHRLDLCVIAVGVETEAQLRFLRDRGCDEMQGNYFSHPLPPEQMAALLQSGQCLELPVVADATERTLLIVDDELAAQAALRRELRREGYRLLFASCAQEGLALLAGNAVGVVIADFRMPGASGVDFLDKARQLYPDTVRIVLSGYSEINAVTEAINRGAAFRFLHKPWEERELLESVHSAFALYEANRELTAQSGPP